MANQGENWIESARAFLAYQVGQGFTEVLLPEIEAEREQASILDGIRGDLGECTRCPLHERRRSIVFGEGNHQARLMFVGEGPGGDEDRQGRPFVGRAGQLLTKMIQAMKLDRSEVYIANIVKCRPPNNRNPKPDEIATCFPFLQRQIRAVAPQVIVALGRVAAGTLLETAESISKLRGRFYEYEGIRVMPTYHPSFLLRKEEDRRFKGEAWSDLKQVMGLLGLRLPGSGDRS